MPEKQLAQPALPQQRHLPQYPVHEEKCQVCAQQERR